MRPIQLTEARCECRVARPDLRHGGECRRPLLGEVHLVDRLDRIADALDFMAAAGLDSDNVDALASVDFYTSHEGLHLPYEQAQTRYIERHKRWYNLSTHFPWIGMRTAALDGAHVEYFRGIRNPIGIKVGPGMDSDWLSGLLDRLNPQRDPGRILLIHRMGEAHIEDKLPALIRAVQEHGSPVLWICDPMHGNTESTGDGIKTRRFRKIMREMELDGLSPALAQRLQQWQQYPSIRALPFQNHSGGAELMANFKPLTQAGDETVLIFLDDNAQVAQQAQQLKLASLGRLTASIAHEIRNPLGAISHAAQLLSESSQLSEQDLRLSEIIQQHSKRMNRVIETVLELSRRRASEPQLVDLGLWIEQFLQDFEPSKLASDMIELECEAQADGEAIMTRMDPNQLSQVLGNLCQNALRYSGCEGEARTIWIRLYINHDSDLPVLEVIDHGPGIDPDHVPHIFEPFYTTEASGTGLGLYISRELCESNQARLEYEPLEPRGCCMRITFAHPKRLV